jgi:hypothetical protein
MRRSVLLASLLASAAHNVQALITRTDIDCYFLALCTDNISLVTSVGSWDDATALASELVATLTTAEKVRQFPNRRTPTRLHSLNPLID